MFEPFYRFIPIAREIAKLSRDKSTQVGCAVVDDDFNVRALAYNGFPRGVNDALTERYARPLKYKWTSHAEENAVANCARIGVSTRGSTFIVTSLFPCTTCSRLMIQAGVKRILAPAVVANTRWIEEERVALEMLEEAGIVIVRYDLP